jgi:hypothetical protein
MDELEWETHDPSGHLRSNEYWIVEMNGRYELSEQSYLAFDGFEVIGTFDTEGQAKEVANKL